MPMNSGHRLAEGDPTVPMVTVSAARAGATDISVATANPSAARPNVRIIRMIILRVHSMRPNDSRPRHCIDQSLTCMISAYFVLADLFCFGASPFSCAR